MHACIDLGSNSFHLLIGEWLEGEIRIVERLSEKVQLGEGVGVTGRISPAAFERGIECLIRFDELMQRYPLENYWALGTNTFRVAKNAQTFLHEAARIGINISPISGVQEAILIYAGVITALPKSDARRLVIDVGGGSTEVIIGRHHKRLITESLAIGSVAWRDRFFAGAKQDATELLPQMDEGKAAAAAVFAKLAPVIMKIGWNEVYASSGTMKMLSYICQEHGYGTGEIHLDGLYALKPVIAQSIINNAELPGLKESRRDLLLPGWCVITGLMETCNINRIHFSHTALREGMLDFMVKNSKTLRTMQRSGLPGVISTTPTE
ncbi:MAG: hypothetical protein ACR2PR_06275 [Pseudohongiellaceae bacterium]